MLIRTSFHSTRALGVSLLALLPACGASHGDPDAATGFSATTVDAGTTTDPDATSEGGTTGGPAEAVVNPDAIIVDQELANLTVVAEGTLRMPVTGYEHTIDRLLPGAIVVGPPHINYADANAAGFLRRVEKIERTADHVEILTSQGSLEDVFEELDLALKFPSPQPEAPLQVRSQPWLEIFDAPPVLADGIGFDFSGKVLVEEPGMKVTLDKGYLKVKPDLDLEAKINKKLKLKYLLAQITAPYDAGLAFSAELDFEGDRHIQTTIVDNEKIATTKFNVAGVPITIVLRMTIDVACDVSASAKAHVGAGVRYYGTPTAGVKYENKDWSSWQDLDFNHKEAAGADMFAQAQIACEAPRVRFEYKLFDVAGPYASVAPTANTELSASFNAQTCEPATCEFAAKVTPGLKFIVGFLVRVLGKDLVDKNSEFPLTWAPWEAVWACDDGWLAGHCEQGGGMDTDTGGDTGTDTGGDTGTDTGGDTGTDTGDDPISERKIRVLLKDLYFDGNGEGIGKGEVKYSARSNATGNSECVFVDQFDAKKIGDNQTVGISVACDFTVLEQPGALVSFSFTADEDGKVAQNAITWPFDPQTGWPAFGNVKLQAVNGNLDVDANIQISFIE